MRAVFKLETLQTSPANKITEKEKVRKTCEITTFEKNQIFWIFGFKFKIVLFSVDESSVHIRLFKLLRSMSSTAH